jgi:hypothetical protein
LNTQRNHETRVSIKKRSKTGNGSIFQTQCAGIS